MLKNKKLRDQMITECFGALSRNRTNDTRIFNPLLYRLSYQGKRSTDPIGIGALATQKGLEPSTSSVTGWHSNQLNYCAVCSTLEERKKYSILLTWYLSTPLQNSFLRRLSRFHSA